MNWDLICYLLENFTIRKKRCRNFTFAECVLLWQEGAPDTEKTVYLCLTSTESVRNLARSSTQHYRNALLIACGELPCTSDNYILLKPGDPAAVLNQLLQAKSHLDALNAALSSATGNQEAVEIATSKLKVPFFYFDPSYRILAISDGMDFPDDPEWKHMKEKGFLSPESVKRMQDSGDLDLLADQKEPFPYQASFYPFQSLVCNIWEEGRFFSRLNMLCINDPPNELHRQECRILCTQLLRIARSSGEQRYFSGPLNNMVLDLLRGVQLSEELISDRLRHMPQLKDSLVQVCCIEANVQGDPQVLSYYASLVSHMFTQDQVLTLTFEAHIVLVMHAAAEEAFAPLHEKLETLLLSQNLKSGASNLFRRFNTIRDHYLQACNALSFGKKSAGLVPFREVYFDYLLSFLSPDQALSMVSYDIQKLRLLQKDYQFPLADTLRCYLECGCNLQLTADRLFIHKNTALYRLNHIRELISTDLEDSDQRMELLISFKLLERFSLSQE